MPTLDHLNMDLNNDGQLERYDLQDTRVDDNTINYELDDTDKGITIQGGFSGIEQNVNYAFLHYDVNSKDTATISSLGDPLIFDNVESNNISVIDGCKISVKKGKTYLVLVEGQIGNWSSLYINLQNKSNTVLCRNGTDGAYNNVSISYIYKPTDDDYVYITLESGNGGIGAVRKLCTTFSVIELDGLVASGGKATTHTYSTEEQVVGTWIDGKPLYEKTFNTTITTSGSKEYFSDVIVADAENYFIENAYAITESDNSIYMIGSSNFNSAYDINITSFNLVNGRWWLIKGANTPSNIIITVRYTKTTD